MRAATSLLATAVLLTLVAGSLGLAATHADERTWTSEAGGYRLSYRPVEPPIGINRMHAWVLHLTDPAGEPVAGAAMQVSGGMPAHDHGLPTQPRVTRELGGGDYLLEGVRFHMTGAWQLRFDLSVGADRDVVTVDLDL